MRMAGIEMTHIPYRGAGPAITDLIPGRLTMMFNTSGSLMPHVQSGRLRALAVSSGKRFSAVPELPTVAESGVPGFDVSSWYGLLAPSKTPPAIVQKMNADAVRCCASPTCVKGWKAWASKWWDRRRRNSARSSERKWPNGARSSRPPTSSRSEIKTYGGRSTSSSGRRRSRLDLSPPALPTP